MVTCTTPPFRAAVRLNSGVRRHAVNFTSHIKLDDWNGQPILTVRDYELMDFLEDHFAEKLGLETSQMHQPSNPPVYHLLFLAGTAKAVVWRALEGIGREEIERIVAINSGAGSAERDA